MIIRTLIICCCLPWMYADHNSSMQEVCLTGYMTDRQSWVNATGALNELRADMNNSIDMSYIQNPVPLLRQRFYSMRSFNGYVKYLSFANCGLTRVPLVYQLSDSQGRFLAETVEYMTFYGNNFDGSDPEVKEYDAFINATGVVALATPNNIINHEATLVWSSTLQESDFPRLKELDLRSCAIQVLNSHIFRRMSKLEALYMGENKIHQIYSEAFVGIQNLHHLDFSRNYPKDDDGNPKNLHTDTFNVFQDLTNLVSLDLSHTRLTPRNYGMIMGLGRKIRSLSICNTGLVNLRAGIFNNIPLEILDISQNNLILDGPDRLQGLENSLRVLYARNIGLKSINTFRNFYKLEILQLASNEINHISVNIASTLQNLQILDLKKNRLTNWINSVYSVMPKLRLLSLKDNNINVISESMIEDLKNIDYLAMSGNFVICNCEVKDFLEMAAINENKFKDTKIKPVRDSLYHIGYDYYNKIILSRNLVVYEENGDFADTGRFRLLDYQPDIFTCLKVPDGIPVSIYDVSSCNDSRDMAALNTGRQLLLILLMIPFLLLALLFLYIFRRRLKYFYITMRNSALLSLINKNKTVDDGTLYHYDVFVSYCNEDRGWVLDHLLPHIESEYSISACLHERDFQVGLSILENIVSCMDRSRYIMLVISEQFLVSRWCQFEMHLAQHRLLETRREDLILVLLEDIPRRLRPTTLHYLMLTKTYIVWPKQKSEIVLFWKRLNKRLLSQKDKVTENVSLA